MRLRAPDRELDGILPVVPGEPHWRPYERPEQELARVFNAFEPHIGCSFCIAGGAVRDRVVSLKPKDYDLFCFGPPDWRRLFATFDAPANEQKQYRDMACLSLRWKGRRVQIVYRNGLTTIPNLLEQFDWCVCQWAFDGVEIRCIGTTQGVAPGMSMRLANPGSTPERSLERGQRFARRFGMSIDREALATLQGMINTSGRLQAIANKSRKGPYLPRRMAA